MAATLQNHFGIETGGAAKHIIQIVQQGAVRIHHKVFMSPARCREARAKIRFQVRIVPLGHVRSILD